MQNTTMQGSTPGTTTTSHTEDLTPRASEKVSQFGGTAHETLDRLTTAASEAASRLSARGEELWALQGRATEQARVYMREHPLATIGIAVAVGLVLSKLLSRR